MSFQFQTNLQTHSSGYNAMDYRAAHCAFMHYNKTVNDFYEEIKIVAV